MNPLPLIYPYHTYWFNQFIRFIDYLINTLCKLTDNNRATFNAI